MKGDDPKDKLRGAREMFDRSRDTFYEGHEGGMGALEESAGEERSERLDDAIETERQAIEQMGEAIRLQREALEGRRNIPEGGDDH